MRNGWLIYIHSRTVDGGDAEIDCGRWDTHSNTVRKRRVRRAKLRPRNRRGLDFQKEDDQVDQQHRDEADEPECHVLITSVRA